MFVLVDPGNQRTRAERRLQAFRVKSYAAARRRPLRGPEEQQGKSRSSDSSRKSPNTRALCHVNKRQKANSTSFREHAMDFWNSPACKFTIPPHLVPITAHETFDERRSVQFFLERTATEWSNWFDSFFWQTQVARASTSHSCIRRAMISLAAVHEALESPGRKPEQVWWALQQGRRALKDMIAEHGDLSLSSLLTSHILIYALTLFLDDKLMCGAMKALFDVEDRIRHQICTAPTIGSDSDQSIVTGYMFSVIDRQKSKLGSLVDMLFSLRMTPAAHFTYDDLSQFRMPRSFPSIENAREILDKVLNWATSLVKARGAQHAFPAVVDLKLASWSTALSALQERTSSHIDIGPTREICNIQILHLSAQVYLMLIKLMHSGDDEMAFDQYIEVYRAIVRVMKLVIDYKKSLCQTMNTLSMEASLLGFAGNAASRWCRDPLVRKELLEVLCLHDGSEGFESAGVWRDISRCIRTIEEEASRKLSPSLTSSPPQSAKDIPEAARVRLLGGKFYKYMRAGGMVGVVYQKFPYRPDGTDDCVVYIPHPGCEHFLDINEDSSRLQQKPDTVIYRGYTSWLNPECDEYYTVRAPSFYYNVSKV